MKLNESILRNLNESSSEEVLNAIDNKGNVVLEMQRSGDNKEEIFNKMEELPENFPVIKVEGLWNGMKNGTLMTLGELKEFLDKYKIRLYGGKDELALYDNLLYVKIVNENEMF